MPDKLTIFLVWLGIADPEHSGIVGENVPHGARYAPNCWLLWSNSEIDVWNTRIKERLSPGDNVLICEVNLTRAGETYTGWGPKWLWEWIQKTR